MKAIFIRHGKDDDRYRGGWSNLDLIPEGVEQAKQLAQFLKDNNNDYNITEIISSDLARTNNGDLAGMLNSTALEQYPGLFFSSLKMDEAYPNGESPNDFFARIKMWFVEFTSKYRRANGNVLVVTHGGVINVIYHLINGIEWDNKARAFKAANCSVHILNMDTMNFEVENRTDFLTT